MLKILIIDPGDTRRHTALLRQALDGAGYCVSRTSLDGGREMAALSQAFEGRPPDMLLADLSDARDCLPLRHAMRLMRQMWGEDVPVPPRLALLTPAHLADKEWHAHADDFLLPPYHPQEMLARLALLAFRRRHIQGADALVIEDLTLDLARAQAFDADGAILPLTHREYELLRFLALHRGKLFARDRLLDMVWGVDFDGGERTVDVHMRRLRAKLPPRAGALLETRRGLGYGLVPAS